MSGGTWPRRHSHRPSSAPIRLRERAGGHGRVSERRIRGIVLGWSIPTMTALSKDEKEAIRLTGYVAGIVVVFFAIVWTTAYLVW